MRKFLERSRLPRVAALWLYWLLAGIVAKPLFMLWYRGLYDRDGWADGLSVAFHGLPLDVSVASYLTAVPLLLTLIGVWWPGRVLRMLSRMWLALAAVLVTAAFLLNVVLYEYWGFPLDSTPLFYFFSSPKDALASAGWGTVVGGLVALVALSVLLFAGACRVFGVGIRDRRQPLPVAMRLVATAIGVLSGGLLFVGMRGGVTVSAMNTGKVYFSQRPELNHAAVNPLFSLLESLSHQSDFSSQYRFMADAEAEQIFRRMTEKGRGETVHLLNTDRPDIYLIVLESFSSKLMKTLGGNGVATQLDSLAGEGVLFTRFYANSFRTDRGLVSILSGYPAQPTMSLMKYPRKTAALPSIARSLKQAGYDLRYYYGGDADFTNMRSYLVSQGFEDIVSDVDFPVKDRLSKWGVPDHLVFERLAQDTFQGGGDAETGGAPLLRVLQTSSSHEPFDVPFHLLADERLNAFAYTDHCVGRFVDALHQSGRWERSLVVLVPDHLGCWPKGISNFDFTRYEIPLLLLGGAVSEPRRVSVVGSQQDLAATLLAQLGLPHGEFPFSKDLLDATAPHFAFFTVPDALGLVVGEDGLIYDNKSSLVVTRMGAAGDSLLWLGKAYLQKLYDDIARR